MFLSITISAKIGKDYDCRRIGAIQMSDGKIQIDFPRDMDITKPFFMICEPDLVEDVEDMDNEDGTDYFKHKNLFNPKADYQAVDGFGETPLSQDISEIPTGIDSIPKWYVKKSLEKEVKRAVPRYTDLEEE